MMKFSLGWKATLPASPLPSTANAQPRKPNRPAPDRAKAFTRWDKDQDGELTLDEYRMGLTNKANAETRFKNFDKNGDGKLTRKEFVRPASK